MEHSTERILTTHVGSLPRPRNLLEMIQANEQGRPIDAEAFAARVMSAVAEVVHKQAAAGIDIAADGEMGRFGLSPERLTGLEARSNPRSEGTWAHPWTAPRVQGNSTLVAIAVVCSHPFGLASRH